MSYRGNRGNKGGPRRNMGHSAGNRSGSWNSDNRDSLPSTRSVNASNWRATTPNPTPNSVPDSSSSTIISTSSPKPVPTSTTTTTPSSTTTTSTTWAAIATAQPPRPSPQASESIDSNSPPPFINTTTPSQPDPKPSTTNMTVTPTSSKPVVPHMPSTSAWANGPPVSVKSRKSNSPTTNPSSTLNNMLKRDNKGSSSSLSNTTTNQGELNSIDPSPTIETTSPTQPEMSESPAPPASFLTASTTGVSSSWVIDDDMDEVEPLPEWFTKPPKPEVGSQGNETTVTATSSVSNRSAGVSQKVLQGFINEASKRETNDSTIQNYVKRGDSRSPTQSTVSNEPFCAPEAAQVLARRVTMAQEEAETKGIKNSVYQPPVNTPQFSTSIGMLYDGKTSFISELNKLL